VELLEGIRTRRSFRAYKSTPIRPELLETVLEAARKSPSFANTQPWEIAVVSGGTKDELSRILCKLAESQTPANPDMPLPGTWPHGLEKRSGEHSTRRFKTLGLEKGGGQYRSELRMANFRFYGAPSAIFIFTDSCLTPWSTFDAGLFAQSLCLAAHSVGLGTCLQATLANYPDAVRQFLGLPKTKRLVIGISIGYPDFNARINTYLSTRIGLDEFVRQYG